LRGGVWGAFFIKIFFMALPYKNDKRWIAAILDNILFHNV
jgi:hypothetical protein